MSLKDFLRDTLDIGKDDVYRVDVKESFSFFNTDATLTELILSTFKDLKIDGRFVNVEVSKSPESSGGRKGKDKDRRRGNDKKKGKFKERSFSKGGSQRTGKRRSKKRDGFF